VAKEVFESMIPHSKPWIIEDDLKAVSHVLCSGMIDQGEQVRLFEDTCAHYLGVLGGAAMGSGTAALTVALNALELKQGSEVILPTYVCKNVAEAVLNAGFVPVFCDVGDHWNMTSETVAKVMTKQAVAIIVVHLFGIPTSLKSFEKFSLPIIEDACQAFGAKIENRMVGSIAKIGVFSFHATKCLTTGEGGLAVSDDPKLLKKMRMLRDGQDHPAIRLTSPMSDLQAALGLSQLLRYDRFLERRRLLAERYFEALAYSPLGLPDAIRKDSIFFRFPVRFKGNFNTIQKKFVERGIHVRQGVDALLHHLTNHASHSFPNAERLHLETVSLPIYPALTDGEQETIIDVCRSIFG
jgi:perosamine synthetase